jgi:hypothetical protein
VKFKNDGKDPISRLIHKDDSRSWLKVVAIMLFEGITRGVYVFKLMECDAK